MTVDFDKGQHDELDEWEDHAVGRAYEVASGDLEGRVFVVRNATEHTERIEGQRTKTRIFSYEWLDTDTEEVEVSEGTATITVASGSEDDPSLGTESIRDHKTKVESGIYREVNDGN
jgi:hypothetical protein